MNMWATDSAVSMRTLRMEQAHILLLENNVYLKRQVHKKFGVNFISTVMLT